MEFEAKIDLVDVQEKSEIELRKDNVILATKLKDLIHKTVERSQEMVDNAKTQNDLYTAIKIAEVAGKITGIISEKSITNVQINQISGFTFVEVDAERIVQERRREIGYENIVDVEV